MDRNLYLSTTNKKIGGVCGGIGEYFGIDPTWVRLIWFLSIFLEGIGLLAYFIAWIIIPRHNSCKNNW
jgi:phage shock protein C